LEMSGTEPGWHEIIQIGAIIYNENWQEQGTFLSNVYPENEESFSHSSAEIHGLTLAELDNAPMLNEVLSDFEAWILKMLKMKASRYDIGAANSAFRSITVCGQSVIYDINFLRFAYRQEKLQWPFSNRMIDLNNLAFYLFEILKANGEAVPRSLSLTAIADFFGFEREGINHNALEDAEITGECLKQVMRYTKRFTLEPE